jgi:tricorn protease
VRVEILPSTRGGLDNLVYENWVRQNREYVERVSNGKLTYLHIQGMNEPSLQRFLREIRTLTPDREGVIIDVRFNGGGSTAHQILSVLSKEPWLIRTTPGEFGYRVSENIWRGDSLELPTALLINENSFSNAEIFAEGFRRMRLGPIIGEATAGGVIGTSSYQLWDGGSIRMPRIGAYAIDGENLERNGRRPDIRVPFDPNAAARGEDPQLDRAIAEMMKRVPKG